jgi:alcohol dehydrogenase class IV
MASDATQTALRFDFAGPGRIIFGRGVLEQVGHQAAGLGGKALLVTGSEAQHADRLRALLDAAGVGHVSYSVPTEPTLEMARRGTELAREAGCDVVIGLGGGSAIDAAKAIAALLGNGGDPLDYIEVVGRGRPLNAPSAPCIAIPTTAGTGSEATRNAVLASPEHGIKASLRSPHMLPRVALVDPQLTETMPPQITASTGLDALTQLVEPFVSARANPMTDAFCREGIPRVIRSLPVAYRAGSNARAREDMALGSLMGGLALGNAGLGAVHGFAGVIGGMFPAPHGAVCAALLPHVTAVNVAALLARSPGDQAVERYRELAGLLTAGRERTVEAAARRLQEMVAELEIAGLSGFGIRREVFAVIVERTKASSSIKANPIVLTDGELFETLERAL